MRNYTAGGSGHWMRRGVAALATALLAAGCGDDPVAEDPAPIEPETPLYLVHSAVQTDTGRMNYFSLVESLDQAATLDYAKSLELPGRPRLYAAQGVGFFAIGSGEAPTITRYEVQDGRLVPGASISLQAYGVGSLGAQAVLFVSPTKAYYKDAAQAQVIVWNPTAMVVEKRLELPADLVRQGSVTGFSQWAAREGEAFFAVGWSNAAYDRVEPGSVLVRIDTATDALTLSEEPRCRDLGKTARVGNALYFFSGVINGLGYAANRADDGGQQDCMLRIPEGQKGFEAGWVGSVAPALGEGKVGTVISVTEDGTAWVQVADLSVTPSAPGTTYSQWYSAGWSWYRLPLTSLTGASRLAGHAGAYSGFTLASGSQFFVSAAAADYSTSTLMELSSGGPRPGVSFPGFVLDVARIR